MTFSLLSRNVCIQLLILHILKSQTSLTARIFLFVCLFFTATGFFWLFWFGCWGGGKVGGGLGGLVGGQGVLVILLLLFGVGLFLNTRASVTTRMAEAFTEDSVVQTTEDF